MTDSTYPDRADVVIVGVGGIVGASIAHFLSEMGVKNIVGLEKAGAIPSDIASTAHASDFVFNTAHDKLTVHTTTRSREFYESIGHFFRRGGLEVCRKDDDKRWEELKRKVGSGKAFGTNVRLISAKETKELFPPVDESSIRGAMYDPDAGLVTPRSQDVVLELVNRAEEAGALRTFTNTPATGFDVKNGRIRGVHTRRGTIEADRVVICSGIWGPLLGDMAGAAVPLMPIEHPLMFFGPFDDVQGTDSYLYYPLFRDQGNSAYVRDTGRIEGGLLEWGYYEPFAPRLVEPSDIGNPQKSKGSDSMRDLPFEQISHGLERALETVPVLGDLGMDHKKSFNGLLSVTNDGGSLIGETPEVRGLWLCEAVWVKDGPGAAELCAEWMTQGHTRMDPHNADIARFYPAQKDKEYVRGRGYETGQKIYDPPVHPREPYLNGRGLFTSPFYEREKQLGGYFDNEVGGWERAYAYEANRDKLKKYLDQVPVRENEWDRRHVPYELANAEHLAMSDHVGMINLSHFAIFDLEGPDAARMMEYLSVAKVGGKKPVGKAVYTNILNEHGGVHSDLTICRIGEQAYRVVTGGGDGNRDWVLIRNFRDDHGYDVEMRYRTHDIATLGFWGPNARHVLSELVDDPEALSNDRCPFASAVEIEVNAGGRKVPVWALRISYVGELGWELYFENDPELGMPLYDAFLEAGVVPVGIETYASSRRLEKCFRLQGADLETEYNAYEAGVARPKVKKDEFLGKEAYLRQREEEPAAVLCTMTVDDNAVGGAPRFPVGMWPLLDPETKEVPVDSKGRRSYTTSSSYCPSIGKHAVMAYLPRQYAQVGTKLILEYFDEDENGHYPVTVDIVGRGSLYDPEFERVRG